MFAVLPSGIKLLAAITKERWTIGGIEALKK
jgi:hypothetical protein